MTPYASKKLTQALDRVWPDKNKKCPSQDKASTRDDAQLLKLIHQFDQRYLETREGFETQIGALVNQDSKSPQLKQLQAYFWTKGFANGDLVTPMYEDAISFINDLALSASNDPTHLGKHHFEDQEFKGQLRDFKPIPIHIFSSGAVSAQKQMFSQIRPMIDFAQARAQAHTAPISAAAAASVATGDRLTLVNKICGFHDPSSVGFRKQEPQAYQEIESQTEIPGSHWGFVSDSVQEVFAASQAEFSLPCLIIRDGNPSINDQLATVPFDPEEWHYRVAHNNIKIIHSFSEIRRLI